MEDRGIPFGFVSSADRMSCIRPKRDLVPHEITALSGELSRKRSAQYHIPVRDELLDFRCAKYHGSVLIRPKKDPCPLETGGSFPGIERTRVTFPAQQASPGIWLTKAYLLGVPEHVCGEFQFRRQPGSERGGCSVGASDMNRGVRSEVKGHRFSELA
jgi:hypothetical protein